MKKWIGAGFAAAIALTAVLAVGVHVKAENDNDNEISTIHSGIYIDHIDVSGMTKEDAEAAVKQHVASLESQEITLKAADGQSVSVMAGELGMSWANPMVVEEACAFGTEGNIVQRYKAERDLEHENKIFPLGLSFDREVLKSVVAEKSGPFNKECVEASLTRVDGGFQIKEGETGLIVDVDASVNEIYDYLTTEWDHESGAVDLIVEVDEPKADKEELSKVKDVLGTFTTSYTSSGKARSANVANGCRLVSGRTLMPGEEFSMYEAISPFSEENGYYMAGSYVNGQVVDSLGGGICQVSTTLYNAVLKSELDVTERHNHSMIVNYVDPSADAAIAESSGKDFRFVNNTEYPVYIEGVTQDKKITFTIYGVESRPSNREVIYESEVLSKTEPETDQIIASSSQPIGFIEVSGAHIGYKAKLWKIVKEDGVEISREEVNSSSYKMTPRTATVGTATTDPEAYNAMLAAIGTGSIDHVKAVAGAIVAANAQIAAQAEAAQQQAAMEAAQQVEQAE